MGSSGGVKVQRAFLEKGSSYTRNDISNTNIHSMFVKNLTDFYDH